MRFIDEAVIRVMAGHGGPGCVSFRREKYVPRGGPDGGDGGAGGDFILIASARLSTLQDFRFKRVYQAANGQHGSGANKAGKDGEDLEVRVPVGTVIKDAQSGEVLMDFTQDGQQWVACNGGRGGKGNAHFVSSTFQAPKFAQKGEEGESKELTLELKLLADAAIIGFPNAGKSTLISHMSAARPKIADYPFTTLTPNLGVVALPGGNESFVIADIPGLIEGAHRGEGLGHRFLKHIERTRVLIHLIDGAKLVEEATCPGIENALEVAVEGVAERYMILRKELGLFNEDLLTKPEIVALNKLDILESDPEMIEKTRQALRKKISELRGAPPTEEEPYVISAVSGSGIAELLGAIHRQILQAQEAEEAQKRSQEESLAADPTRLPDDEDIRR